MADAVTAIITPNGTTGSFERLEDDSRSKLTGAAQRR
jgi:hypothetical protein